jgi:hypothetical protein
VQVKEDLEANQQALQLMRVDMVSTCRRHIQNTASEVMQQALRKGLGEDEQVAGQGRYPYFWKSERERFKSGMRLASDALHLKPRDLVALGAKVIRRRNSAIHGVCHADVEDARRYLENYPELNAQLKDERLVILAAFESHEWWDVSASDVEPLSDED